MTEVEQLLWCKVYSDSVKVGMAQSTSITRANDAVDNFRTACGE